MSLLTSALSFPLRYFGSKHSQSLIERALGYAPNPGYQSFSREISKTEATALLPYAITCPGTFNPYANDLPRWLKRVNLEIVKPSQLGLDLKAVLGNLQANELCFFDPKTSLKIVLYTNNESGELIVSFGPVQSYESEVSDGKHRMRLFITQIRKAALNLLGFQPRVFQQAYQFCLSILQLETFNRVTLTGQSFGGAIAQYVSMKTKLKAYCFNSMALGPGLQYSLGQKALSEAHQKIHHLIIRRDWVSDYAGFFPLRWIDRALNLIGFRTPGNFGSRACITSAYFDLFRTHKLVLGSLLNKIGYHRDSDPEDLSHV